MGNIHGSWRLNDLRCEGRRGYVCQKLESGHYCADRYPEDACNYMINFMAAMNPNSRNQNNNWFNNNNNNMNQNSYSNQNPMDQINQPNGGKSEMQFNPATPGDLQG